MAQRRQQRFPELGGGKGLGQVSECVVNAVVESDGGDRYGIGAGTGGQRHRPRRQFAVEHGTRTHFLPVVILRVDPEDRDRRHLMVARDLFGQFQRRQRFQQREQRSAEESRLLTRHDRHGSSIGEQARRLSRAQRRLTTFLLSSQDRSDLRSAAIVGLGPRDRFGPCSSIGGIAGKKRRNGSKIVRVVGGQTADPREPPNVDRNANMDIGVRPGLRV